MNSKKIIAISIGVICVIIVGILISRSSRMYSGGTHATTTVSVISNGHTYTMADVASHNSQTSCWTAISGKVFDVTAWISQHPGGAQAILSLCGIDGTRAFVGQHGGQARPANELASFYIGDVK